MTLLYIITIVFSFLTICFCYDEYKKHSMSKKNFTIISIMESVVIIILTVMAII